MSSIKELNNKFKKNKRPIKLSKGKDKKLVGFKKKYG